MLNPSLLAVARAARPTYIRSSKNELSTHTQYMFNRDTLTSGKDQPFQDININLFLLIADHTKSN